MLTLMHETCCPTGPDAKRLIGHNGPTAIGTVTAPQANAGLLAARTVLCKAVATFWRPLSATADRALSPEIAGKSVTFSASRPASGRRSTDRTDGLHLGRPRVRRAAMDTSIMSSHRHNGFGLSCAIGRSRRSLMTTRSQSLYAAEFAPKTVLFGQESAVFRRVVTCAAN